MITSPQNKGIVLIGIMTIGIIAALQNKWGVVASIITGAFALLRI